jgi:hypothetical protein
MPTTLHFHRPAAAKPAPSPAPSLLARLLAWWRPKPAYKMAPRLSHPEYLALHVSEASGSRSALR